MVLSLLKKTLGLSARKEGQGTKAPALLLAGPKNPFLSFWHKSRGYVRAGAGVAVAFVTFVSVLTWLSGYVGNPISRPIEIVERVLPGVLEQVDDQVAQAVTLLGVDKETVGDTVEKVREGLVGARLEISRIANAATTTSSSSVMPSSFTAFTAQPTPSSTSAMPTSQEEAPSSSSTPTTTTANAPTPSGSEKPSVPAATEEPLPPTTSEPTSSPATEEPPPPPAAPPEPSQPPPPEPPPLTMDNPAPPHAA